MVLFLSLLILMGVGGKKAGESSSQTPGKMSRLHGCQAILTHGRVIK